MNVATGEKSTEGMSGPHVLHANLCGKDKNSLELDGYSLETAEKEESNPRKAGHLSSSLSPEEMPVLGTFKITTLSPCLFL